MTISNLLPSNFPLQKAQIINYLYKINYYKKETWNEEDFPLPTLNTLSELMKLHLISIPFGCLSLSYFKSNIINNTSQLPNLISFGKEFGISTNINDVYQKLIVNSREGYCFEHNQLFKYILEYLGYNCLLIMVKPIDAPHFTAFKEIQPTGIQHVGILVQLENKTYYVDVGFSPPSLSVPLELDNAEPTLGLSCLQNRVIEAGSDVFGQDQSSLTSKFYEVQYRIPIQSTTESNNKEIDYTAWKPLMFFYKVPCQPSDLEIMNAWVSISPKSYFRNHIVLSRFIEQGQVVLFDNIIKVFQFGKLQQKISLINEQERRLAYKKWFGISLDDDLTEVLPLSFGEEGAYKL